MVRLYKDPDGEHVFTAHEEAMQMTTALGGPQQAIVTPQLPDDDNIDLLKKKIQQMEDTIKEYKVVKTNFLLYTTSLYILTESRLYNIQHHYIYILTECPLYRGLSVRMYSDVVYYIGCTNVHCKYNFTENPVCDS